MKKNKWASFLIIIIAVLIAGASYASGEFSRPTKKDKCPVCGMFPYKHPSWIAEITFNDGSYTAFDGPKDMFRFCLQFEKYSRSNTRADIKTIYVTDYYTLQPIDAREAFFIIGSDVYGPMGNEFVPVTTREAAEAFLKDHHGAGILRFDDVTQDVISSADRGSYGKKK